MASSVNTFLVTSFFMFCILANFGKGGSLGVNFGRQASQKLLPSMVVDMCLANGVSKVKLFSVNEGVMSAFSGTNIELIVALSNIEMDKVNSTDGKIRGWIERHIENYRNNFAVDIRYVCVGVEPFSKIERIWVAEDYSYLDYLVNYTRIMDTVLSEKDLRGKVKLGVPVATDILSNVSKPSEGDFANEWKGKLVEVLNILNKTDSPFMINIYPYLSVTRNRLPLEFGLFDKGSNYTVVDEKLIYTNIFDVIYDTLVWALRKNGFGNMKIMVTQVGWPTDGGPGANVKNAKRFYDGLLKKIATNKGTPLVTEVDWDVYLYELADENQRRMDRGAFERHYGIYYADGRPKFNIDLTLQGRDITPDSANGVMYLPQRWCILNKTAAGKASAKEVNDAFDKACSTADCSALVDGGSCSYLDNHSKVSYAFNSFFQINNQEDDLGDAACNFSRLGQVTKNKPIFPGCEFQVQILSTLFQKNLSNAEMVATLGSNDNGGEKLRLGYQLVVSVPFLWLILSCLH